ncbi:hypothetical protein H4Q26_007753 [Puccinia striiformis f. sp. tritici PST-130]|nr:hypothetical protein H4Q26_007753 [Puccinia striiformis f. sp. tritici PST-130]
MDCDPAKYVYPTFYPTESGCWRMARQATVQVLTFLTYHNLGTVCRILEAYNIEAPKESLQPTLQLPPREEKEGEGVRAGHCHTSWYKSFHPHIGRYNPPIYTTLIQNNDNSLGYLPRLPFADCLFSLMMLILPYTRPTKRPQWFFKKSHIPAQLRGKACQTPIYLINTGFFMCVAQLLGSLNTIAFICLQINPSRSLNYALRAQPLIPLGLMYMFEILAYWIMAHCFISLSYSSLDSAGRKAISLAKWEPPPAVVNVVFTCLPLCMVALITGTIIHGAVGYMSF